MAAWESHYTQIVDTTRVHCLHPRRPGHVIDIDDALVWLEPLLGMPYPSMTVSAMDGRRVFYCRESESWLRWKKRKFLPAPELVQIIAQRLDRELKTPCRPNGRVVSLDKVRQRQPADGQPPRRQAASL